MNFFKDIYCNVVAAPLDVRPSKNVCKQETHQPLEKFGLLGNVLICSIVGSLIEWLTH